MRAFTVKDGENVIDRAVDILIDLEQSGDGPDDIRAAIDVFQDIYAKCSFPPLKPKKSKYCPGQLTLMEV